MPIKVNEPFALRRLMVVKCRDGSLATDLRRSRDLRFSSESDLGL